MTDRRSRPLLRRGETWLRTGPLGHLLGGTLDLIEAVARHQLRRARDRRAN